MASQLAAANLVEPLSNGLALSMTKPEIVSRFGEPPNPTWDSRTFGYRDFSVQVGGQRLEIWRVTLKGVKLNCGIGAGSSRADVVRAFGKPDGITYDQYQLTFSYTGDRVESIKIEPAKDSFAAISGPASQPAKKEDVSLVGKWYGAGSTMGLIEMRPDGSYSYGQARGTYSQKDGEIIFTGSLTAWNNGHAKIKNGILEFYWTNAQGFKQYFTFAKYQ